MKTITVRLAFALSAIVLLFPALPTHAQWQHVNTYNVGVTGRTVVHGSTVFLYGYQGGFKLYRSADEGGTWQDITSGVPEQFSDIYSFNGNLYACWLSTVFTSTNLGDTWTPLSTVTVTGNGALLGFAADGSTLFAFSNRKSVFKSNDNGGNWTEVLVNNPNSILMSDFCAVGNRYVAIMNGGGGLAGSWISDDGGISWGLRNPATAASGVYAHNGAVYALTFGGGIFRMAGNETTWTARNTGLPDNGQFVIPYSATSRGNTLYLYYIQLISNKTGVLQSADGGQSWAAFDTAGFPPANAAGSARRIAATASGLFFFNYATTAVGGTYRASRSASSVEYAGGPDAARGYSLAQNYPNPFNPSTRIRFAVPVTGKVSLRIFDVLGSEVAELVNTELGSGTYESNFDGAGRASGMYIYRLDAGNATLTRRMLLVR